MATDADEGDSVTDAIVVLAASACLLVAQWLGVLT